MAATERLMIRGKKPTVSNSEPARSAILRLLGRPDLVYIKSRQQPCPQLVKDAMLRYRESAAV